LVKASTAAPLPAVLEAAFPAAENLPGTPF